MTVKLGVRQTLVGQVSSCWGRKGSTAVDPAPRISVLPPRYRTTANTNQCLFHRPIALHARMPVKIDMRGDGGSRACSTSRMSAYFRYVMLAEVSHGVEVDLKFSRNRVQGFICLMGWICFSVAARIPLMDNFLVGAECITKKTIVTLSI